MTSIMPSSRMAFAAPKPSPAAANRRAGDFAAALAGASAAAGPQKSPTGASYAAVEADFSSWLAARSDPKAGAGTDHVARLQENAGAFLAVVKKAEDAGGFDDPVGFVKSLSTDELLALQAIHGLADPIDPATLSREGAFNLIVSRGTSRDLDGDGQTEVGAGRTLVFPPNEAPQAVKDAWASATKDMDFATQLHLQMHLSLAPRAEDGAAAWTKAGFSYADLVTQATAALNDPRQPLRDDVQRAHHAALLSAMEKLGIAMQGL